MLRQTVDMTGLSGLLKDGLARFEAANTAAMREAATGLKEEYRDQVFAAGLGRRLAYTWQGSAYPKSGAALEPAAYVYSKAPRIISLFATGAIIRPVNGSRYLWIPTRAVPKHVLKQGRRDRDVVQAVEAWFNNSDVFFRPGRRGHVLAYVEASAARSSKRYGKATLGPRKRAAKPIHVFTLVRQVQGRKLLDLEGPAQRWAARFPVLVEKHWSE